MIRVIALLLLAMILSACGAAQQAPSQPSAPAQLTPAPQATTPPQTALAAPQATTLPQTVAAGGVPEALTSQLKADDVLVRNITFAADDPAKLIVEYDFNQHRIANAPEGVEAGFAVENERVVHAVTKRVVAQVTSGAKIDQVEIHEHVGGVSSITLNVNIQDMQAWSAGQIDDNAYRQIWQRKPAAYPYPAP